MGITTINKAKKEIDRRFKLGKSQLDIEIYLDGRTLSDDKYKERRELYDYIKQLFKDK